MKYNMNVIKSVWRRWRKPGRATLEAIGSQNPRTLMVEAVIEDARRKNPNLNYAMQEVRGEAKRKAQRLDAEEWKRLTQTLHSTVWQHVAWLEADRYDVLTAAKAVVDSRDINVDRRPSSVSINVLRETIARVQRRKA